MNDRAPGGSGSDRSGTVPDRPWLQHSRSNAASTRPRPNGGAAARADGPAAGSNGASNGNNGASNGNGRQSMPGPRPGGSRDTRNGGALPPRSLQTPDGAAAGTADEASPLQSVKAKADSLKRQAADRKAAKAEARRRADSEKSIAAREAAPATPVTPVTAPAPAPSPAQAAPPSPVTRSGAAAGVAAGATAAHETTSVRTPTITAQQPTKKAKPPARTRKARLRVTKIDPWSVMKISFLLSIAFGIVTVVMVYVVWTAITASSLFPDINNVVNKVVLGSQAGSTTPFRVQDYIHTNKIMGVTTLIAGVDVLIMTALATLGSFLYNLAASLLGGFELTLASDD